MTQTAHAQDNLFERIPVLVILGLLVFLIFARTGENVHGQMTKLGELFWDDYFTLRSDLTAPTCNPSVDVEARLDELERKAASADIDDLFATEFDREAARTSIVNQQALCAQQHAQFATYQERLTPAVSLFRDIEHQFSRASIFATAQQQLFLVLLLFFAAAVATMKRHHIAFRPIMSEQDHRVSIFLQLIANSSLAISAWAFRETALASSIQISSPIIINTLAFGSTALALISLYQMVNMPKGLEPGGSIKHALLATPLYTIVMLIFAFIVFVKQEHLAGLSIYFSAFFENAGTYLDVALYLWCGMLLKQTQVGERVFSVFTPWRLPPELLAFVAIAVIALPTAYTGASAIIILALGAVTYRELRKVGTRRQLALAATAMSGSSGIILKPCLIVVIIAILNKEVTTDQLFGWGVWVFLLTLSVFFMYALITKQDKLQVARASEALAPSLANLRALLPYVITFALVAAFYGLSLDAYLDQFSAPVILPVIIFALIVFERKFSRAEPLYHDPERHPKVTGAVVRSMSDSATHVGGLLMLMATFIIITALGGKSMSMTFLQNYDNIFVIMAMLMGMFVLIGMFMESMAAVGLVSLTIAPIAYAQGIDPIHFWMTCLVALELGYLTPPVALSHIFTRQVVGEEEARLAALEGHNFYYRYERLLLPLLVMGTTLLIVGFGPLLYGYR